MTSDDQKPVDTVEELVAELTATFRRGVDGLEAQGSGRAEASACMFRAMITLLEEECSHDDAEELARQAHQHLRARSALSRAHTHGSA